jgi:RNA polymerase sigma factor (sigma-70 family)
MLAKDKIIELYERHGRELFVYIYRTIGSHDTAEDILHDCFVNLIVYSKRHDIDEMRIRAFLYRTAHNLCVNHLKKSRRIKLSSLKESNDSLVDNRDIANNVEYEELNKKIYTLLDDIDELSRSMFLMKKELDMSIAEIASNTGKSERTVRRRLKRVINYLSDSLTNSGFISFMYLFLSIFYNIIVIYYMGIRLS